MGILAFLLESPHEAMPRSFRDRMRSVRGSVIPAAPDGDPDSDAEIGKRYARLGARRVLTEGMTGGGKFDRLQRLAGWRARFMVLMGDAHDRILESGVGVRDHMLAEIRDRAERKARAAELERARLDRAFFGLDAVEVIRKRPRLALSR